MLKGIFKKLGFALLALLIGLSSITGLLSETIPVLAVGEPVTFTNVPDSITDTSAHVTGGLTNMGSHSLLYAHFLIVDFPEELYPMDIMVMPMTTTGNFSAWKYDLTPDQEYMIMAYVSDEDGVNYMSDFEFFTATNAAQSLEVGTGAAIVNGASVTLYGVLSKIGNATSVDVSFDFGDTMLGYSYNYPAAGSPLTATDGFNTTITGLQLAHTYYYRAKAVGNNGQTIYGLDDYFMTPGYSIISITTTAPLSVTNNSAVLTGNLGGMGGLSSVKTSFQFGNSTLYGQLIDSDGGNRTSTGTFTKSLTDLSPNTTYHYRVVANYPASPVYGTDMSFTTLLPVVVPTIVTTSLATNITNTTATLNGHLQSIGSYPPSLGTFVVTANGSPFASYTINVTATGDYSYNATGLSPGTNYFYAFNAYDAFYSNIYNALLPPAILAQHIATSSGFPFTTGGVSTAPFNIYTEQALTRDVNIPNRTITLSETLPGMGTNTVVHIYFTYRLIETAGHVFSEGGTQPNKISVGQDVTSAHTYTETISGIEPYSEYSYTAVARGLNTTETVYGNSLGIGTYTGVDNNGNIIAATPITDSNGYVITPTPTGAPTGTPAGTGTLPGGGRGSIGPIHLPDDWVTSGTTYVWWLIAVLVIAVICVFIMGVKSGGLIAIVSAVIISAYWISAGWVDPWVVGLLIAVVAAIAGTYIVKLIQGARG